MLNLLFAPLVILYFGVVAALFIYGLNFFYLTALAGRRREAAAPAHGGEWPRVTVQLPIYNELYVAERLILAVGRLDYPADRLEIQVLDDSTDETAGLVRRAVEGLRARGLNAVQLRRAERAGFKAGALAAGLELAGGEFIALFDADFVPAPDFLRRALPHFTDKRVAFVQARWGHLNRDYSLLTRLQAFAIDAHFMVEQFARARGGYFFNFNGTAGVWRTAALLDAGGWTADTLTEDMDLSYRAFLKGWQARYVRELEVAAEVPVSLNAYRRQQHRWARGSMECALKFLPQLWRARLTFGQKLEATLHLTGYGVHLLMFLMAVLYPLMLAVFLERPELAAPFGMAAVLNVTAFAPLGFFVLAQQQLGRRWWRSLPLLVFMSVFGAGMMLNTMRAALAIFAGRRAVFERTPKFALAHARDAWAGRRYQLRLDPLVFAELAFGMLNLATALFAVAIGSWVTSIYAFIFAGGLLFTSLLTLAESLAGLRRRPAAEAA